MNSRKCAPEILFDLLKVQVGNSLYCEVHPASLCPWKALTLALSHVPEHEIKHCSWPRDIDEVHVRARVVAYYWQQPLRSVENLIQEKLDDTASFFNIAGYKTIEAVKPVWSWYLLCLTFNAETRAKDVLRSLVVLMPFDRVDLRIVAEVFKLTITVSRFLEESMRFTPALSPSLCHMHFVHHDVYWAPVFGRKRDDPSLLMDEIVRLVDFPGKLAPLSGRTGYVIGYDESQGLYHVLMEGAISIFMHREQILEVIMYRDYPSYAEKVAIDMCMKYPLEGIPDNGLEFTLLHEIVSRKARVRLELAAQKLSGREDVTELTELSDTTVGSNSGPVCTVSDAKTNTSVETLQLGALAKSTHQESTMSPEALKVQTAAEALSRMGLCHTDRRISLSNALALIDQNVRVFILATSVYQPKNENELQIMVGDELWFRGVDEDRAHVVMERANVVMQRQMNGWCPLDCVCIFEVKSTFAPQLSWEKLEEYLPLSMGDDVVVTVHYHEEWEGW